MLPLSLNRICFISLQVDSFPQPGARAQGDHPEGGKQQQMELFHALRRPLCSGGRGGVQRAPSTWLHRRLQRKSGRHRARLHYRRNFPHVPVGGHLAFPDYQAELGIQVARYGEWLPWLINLFVCSTFLGINCIKLLANIVAIRMGCFIAYFYIKKLKKVFWHPHIA